MSLYSFIISQEQHAIQLPHPRITRLLGPSPLIHPRSSITPAQPYLKMSIGHEIERLDTYSWNFFHLFAKFEAW